MLKFDETRQIAIIWDIDDVKSQAKERHMNITDQQALEILHSMKHNHDCTLGITWETINAQLDMLGT